jgi:pimeloyl-ACP methyl ester carboxylesterase
MTDFVLSLDRAGDLPYLQIVPADATPNTPLVLVLHGLGSYKEKILPTVLAFAQAGYRVVAPDARLHGARPHANERELRMTDAYIQTMYEVIAGTSEDISTLLDVLGAERVGVHGISLGGYIAFAAMLNEPRLAVVSVAMGSPDWLESLRALGADLTNPAFAMLAQANPLDNAASTLSWPRSPVHGRYAAKKHRLDTAFPLRLSDLGTSPANPLLTRIAEYPALF